VDEINRAAVQIARKVAAEGNALVAGNLSLTWAYDPSDPDSFDHVRALFDRQIECQLDAGGVDFFIGETFSYLGEALLFVERARLSGRPVMVTMSFEADPARSYEDIPAADCARRMEAAGADIVGVNCLNAPQQQLSIAVEMRRAVSCHVASQPVAYRTDSSFDFTASANFPYELDRIQLSRKEMAAFAEEARRAGIGYIGSCCGSVQSHVKAMAKVLGKLADEERSWRSPTGMAMSAYEYYHHDQTEV
jgi:methionine synthase I (cobalamin-dependent)